MLSENEMEVLSNKFQYYIDQKVENKDDFDLLNKIMQELTFNNDVIFDELKSIRDKQDIAFNKLHSLIYDENTDIGSKLKSKFGHILEEFEEVLGCLESLINREI